MGDTNAFFKYVDEHVPLRMSRLSEAVSIESVSSDLDSDLGGIIKMIGVCVFYSACLCIINLKMIFINLINSRHQFVYRMDAKSHRTARWKI